jgi:putative addiction module component (TIGR02574 family)
MASDAESVRAAALQLSAEERASLAAELIESLDDIEDVPEDVEAAWAEEVGRRLAEVDAGTVTPVPWSEARRRIRAVVNRGRETD